MLQPNFLCTKYNLPTKFTDPFVNEEKKNREMVMFCYKYRV